MKGQIKQCLFDEDKTLMHRYFHFLNLKTDTLIKFNF